MSKLPLDMHYASLAPCCHHNITYMSAYCCKRLSCFLGFGPYTLIQSTKLHPTFLYDIVYQSLYPDAVLHFIFHADVTGIDNAEGHRSTAY